MFNNRFKIGTVNLFSAFLNLQQQQTVLGLLCGLTGISAYNSVRGLEKNGSGPPQRFQCFLTSVLCGKTTRLSKSKALAASESICKRHLQNVGLLYE